MKTINDQNRVIEDTPEDIDRHQAAQKGFWARAEANENRADIATAAGAQALARLLTLAETRDSGQIRRVALFIGACWNGARHFDLFELRGLDAEISDDMLAVLDALRWARVAVEDLVPDGDKRIQKVLIAWGMYGEDQTRQFICARE